jgi:hypothetical protein
LAEREGGFAIVYHDYSRTPCNNPPFPDAPPTRDVS